MHAEDTEDEASLESEKANTPQMSPHIEENEHADAQKPKPTTLKNSEEESLKDLSPATQDKIARMPPKLVIEAKQSIHIVPCGALVDALGGDQYDINSVETVQRLVQTPAIQQVKQVLTIQNNLNSSVLIKASEASQVPERNTIDRATESSHVEGSKDTSEAEMEPASEAPTQQPLLSDASEPNRSRQYLTPQPHAKWSQQSPHRVSKQVH